MSPDDSETTSTERLRMVRRQLSGRGISDERVLNAMAEVPRELFVPPELQRNAYRDGAEEAVADVRFVPLVAGDEDRM